MKGILVFGVVDIVSAVFLRYAFPSTDAFTLLPFVFIMGFAVSFFGMMVTGYSTDCPDNGWGWIGAANLILLAPATMITILVYILTTVNMI